VGNWLDKSISFISPSWGARREAFRTAQQLQAGYRSAFSNRLSTQWDSSESIGGIYSLNLSVHRAMRDRARGLVDNNPIASSILDRATENIVGNGFQLQILTADPEWNKQAEALFHRWFTHDADYYGNSWIQHQRLVCNSLLRDGDIGANLLRQGQVQLVEGDYISSPDGSSKTYQPDGKAYLHDGVELNKYGVPSRYWVMTYVDLENKDWTPVSANNFIFLANRRRLTQYRGETKFAQTFNLFDQFDGYLNAVVVAQKIAACLALFVTTKSPSAGIAGLDTGTNAQGKTQRKWNLEPGMIQELMPNEEISQVSPQQPGGGFDANLKALIRILGLSFGLPLEYALLDFSQVSGATAKASAMQAQRSFETIQRLLIDEYYSRLYRWRVSKFIKDGLLEPSPDAFHHRWHAEPWPYLDPVKEIQAKQLSIDAGLTTVRREVMSLGLDPEQLIGERATEVAAMRSNHIPVYHTTYVQEVGVNTPNAIKQIEDSGDEQTNTEVGNELPGRGSNDNAEHS
jgi:lambda family phage portal protein